MIVLFLFSEKKSTHTISDQYVQKYKMDEDEQSSEIRESESNDDYNFHKKAYNSEMKCVCEKNDVIEVTHL